ncbi:MAG: formylglycine-generating enzyme family protein [Alphaproteobacteria bacterium]|nr:formylglycine-generating enzyme family protein [Alphaproteobacteria bacterium]
MRPFNRIVLLAACALGPLTLSGAVAAAEKGVPPAVPGVRDCPVCPEVVPIPAGRFRMGTPEEDARADGVRAAWARTEGPVREVDVAAFAMGRTEVTVGQYRAFFKDSGAKVALGCTRLDDGRWRWDANRFWNDPKFYQHDDEPVTCVSWADAQSYAAWLKQRTGLPFRLPSEAEWEYAARAGSGASRPWGDRFDRACAFANVRDQSAKPRFRSGLSFPCQETWVFTAPVGTFPANAFGLFDMLGNVSEWVLDCWRDSYAGAPADGRPVEVDRCPARIRRGGGWESGPEVVRAGMRSKAAPGARDAAVGFRVARDLAPGEPRRQHRAPGGKASTGFGAVTAVGGL